ncbi:hypothetical protein G6F60_013823 [Rhizopus arrhizus]|nr:hypothetical protein G6F33_013919 [Rhizopus arrhizus]KAG1388173.1 hypothetical protein G6F60_013823 [Rhizopus arrhizus]
MKTRVWWPRMQEDINAWISKCPKCQLAASPDKNNHHAPMKPLEVPPAFSRWHLDFIGELPITKNGNRWLLMAVDYTTNWPIARALKNATGEEICLSSKNKWKMREAQPNIQENAHQIC